MAALSNTFENKIIDWLFRGQALGINGASAAATDASAGVEVSGNSYARVAVSSGLSTWAGTQSAGSTAVSSGTNGTTSNNLAVTFPTPTPSGWGTVTAFGVFDSASGGTLLFYGSLTISKTLNAGDSVQFSAGTLTFQIDN